MSSRLSPALAEFAEGRWPGERSLDPRAYGRPTYDQHPYDRHTLERHTLDQNGLERQTMEPPLHPSEREPYESGLDQFENNERWSASRRVAAALTRFLIVFGIGVAATLVWQSYSGAARRMVAGLSPELGWLAQPPAVSPPLASSPSASPDQIAAISRSLTVVRQSVDKLAADITRLQTAKQDPSPVRTAGSTTSAPQPAAAPPARKPTPGPPVMSGPTTAR
jgi:hypothetical protein